MKGMDIKGQNKSRGSGELSNGNPLWKSQITGKTEPPPSDPPLDVNNNNVAEEGGGVAPQGEKNVGVDDEGLLLSNMEDIADLLDDDCPSPRQTREGGEAEDKDGDEEHGEEEEEGKTKELEQKGEEKEVEKKKQMEEFSLATSLSSQDIGGHREPPRGKPDEDEVVLIDEAVCDGMEDGNEEFSGPKTLSSLDRGRISLFQTLSSKNDWVTPCLDRSMFNNDDGGMNHAMAWPKTHEEENGEILSMHKSLSSQVNGVYYSIKNNDEGRGKQYWNKNLKIVKFNKRNIFKNTKKKIRGRCCPKMTKRSCGKKQGRGNIKKQVESMKNDLNDLKRKFSLMTDNMNDLKGDYINDRNGSVIHLLTVGTVENMKKKGREFTKALPKIVKYVMFGSVMAAIGYMAGSTT